MSYAVEVTLNKNCVGDSLSKASFTAIFRALIYFVTTVFVRKFITYFKIPRTEVMCITRTRLIQIFSLLAQKRLNIALK